VAIAIEYPAELQVSTFDTGVKNSPRAGLKLQSAANHPPYLLGTPAYTTKYLTSVPYTHGPFKG
jgi:hypothetical protein